MKRMTLCGELYLDASGEAHFVCHTPGGMVFDEAKAGLLKFIDLLQDKVDNQNECPYSGEGARRSVGVEGSPDRI